MFLLLYPDSSGDDVPSGGQEGPPASSQRSRTQPLYLHGVVGVLIVEDKRLLDELVVTLQQVNLWLIVDNALFILPQVAELVLQGAVHLNGDPPNLLRIIRKEITSDQPALHLGGRDQSPMVTSASIPALERLELATLNINKFI